MDPINFFTPVQFGAQNTQTGHTLLEACDSLFFFGGKKAEVIKPFDSALEAYPIHLIDRSSTFIETAIKVACLMTVVIPIIAIVAKVLLRSTYEFVIVPSDIKPEESDIEVETKGGEIAAPVDVEPPNPATHVKSKGDIAPKPKLSDVEAKALRVAARLGDEKTVEELVQTRTILMGDRGWCVRIAAQFGNLAILKHLLSDESEIAACDRGAAFYHASLNGHVEVVKHLSKSSVIPKENRRMALCKAAANGHLEVMQEVLKYEATIELGLIVATRHLTGFSSFELFYEEAKKQSMLSKDDKTRAFYRAAANSHLDVLQELLKDSGELSDGGLNQTLVFASSHGHLDVVKELLRDERLNEQGFRMEAIREASKAGYLEIVLELLKDLDFDPEYENDSDSIHGFGPVVDASEIGRLDVVQALLAAGVLFPHELGFAAFCAASTNHWDVVQELLKEENEVSPEDRQLVSRIAIGTTSLAERYGHLEVVQQLLQEATAHSYIPLTSRWNRNSYSTWQLKMLYERLNRDRLIPDSDRSLETV